MTHTKRILIPFGAGLAGMFFLTGLYFGIMSWAEGFKPALELFWSDRWIVIPIIIGFGIQAALYAILKFQLYIPVESSGPSGALMGASGTTSTLAMVACCVHHFADVLPILGLTAAATILGRYRTLFLWSGLGMNLVGILIMLIILFKERQKAIQIPNNNHLAEAK
jgi:hypothetical protein